MTMAASVAACHVCTLWFMSADAVWGKTGSKLEPHDPTKVAAVVQYGLASGELTEAMVGNTSIVYTNIYNDTAWSGGHTYHSPIIHHVLLPDLQPATQYFYRVGECLAGCSGW
jgi:hypothetical protein